MLFTGSNVFLFFIEEKKTKKESATCFCGSVSTAWNN